MVVAVQMQVLTALTRTTTARKRAYWIAIEEIEGLKEWLVYQHYSEEIK
jgi:hypothetical protein